MVNIVRTRTGTSGSIVTFSRACAARSARSTSAGSGHAKSESQIAGAFWQRDERLVGLGRDPDVCRCSGRLLPSTPTRREDATRGNRDHHHAERQPSRTQPSTASPSACRSSSSSMSSGDYPLPVFAQIAGCGNTGRRFGRAATSSMYRAALVHAALRVDRAMPQAHRLGGGRTVSAIPCWTSGRRRGRRDVEGFLEKGTIEQIGLVEEREDAKLSVAHAALPGRTRSLDEFFDEHRIVHLMAFAADIRRLQDRAQPVRTPPRAPLGCSRASRRGSPTARAA